MDDPKQDPQDDNPDGQEPPEEDSMFPMPEMDMELREGLAEEHEEKEGSDD
jgi:hypothetical protein